MKNIFKVLLGTSAAIWFSSSVAVAAESISLGTYFGQALGGDFLLEIKSNGSSGRGKYSYQSNYGAPQSVTVTDQGRMIVLKGYGYTITVNKNNISPNQFKAGIRGRNGHYSGITFRKQ